MKKFIIFIVMILSCQSNENLDEGQEIDLKRIDISQNKYSISLDTSDFILPITILAKWIDNTDKMKMFFKDDRFTNINSNDLMYWLINDDSLRPDIYNQFYIAEINKISIKNENYWEDKFLIYFASKISDREVKYFAVSKDNLIYLLSGFGINDINKLINNEIGVLNNETVAYKVARFMCCYTSNEMFPILIVDHHNYDSLKTMYYEIMLPKMKKYQNGFEIEIFSIAYNDWEAVMKNSIVVKNNRIESYKIDTLNKYK